MITTHVVIAPSDGAVLSRLPMGHDCFWLDRTLSECVGHRYALKCPGARAAFRTAQMWGGTHDTLQVINGTP